MRKVTFGGATSLDHYIASSDGGLDWLLWSDDAGRIMREYWTSIDTVVLGRKTFEAAQQLGKSSKNPYAGMRTFVYSRTLAPKQSKDVEIVADAVEHVRQLKQEPGKDICCMGGGELGRSLLDAGLIDEVGLNVHPVLLGSGVPLFLRMERQSDLELVECRALEHGCVYVLYRVKRRR